MLRIPARLASLLTLALAGILMAPSAAPAAGRLGVMLPAHGGPLAKANATQDSLNWSGYGVLPSTGHRVTDVASTFVVPAVDGTTPGFAATWTGIGGYNSSDLIQAGTAEEYVNGLGPSYYAWYEILPASETQIANCSGDVSCTVRPGDTITVTITATGAIQPNQTWSVGIVDAGHWNYSIGLTYASTYSSAEWILEAPSVGAQTVMPMMATTKFDPNNTFTNDNGTAQNIGAGSPVEITMNSLEGIPSPLDVEGDGFNGCAYKLSCPAPLS